MTRPGRVVAVLGAESTGKSTLAHALREALVAAGTPADEVVVVDEVLRAFCDAAGRTPRRDEQAGIAAEQTRRIAAAAERHDWVIADTTALLTAVYHEQVFDDRSLYPVAEAMHARADATLLTALDLPWVADGLQRDGPQVRAPVDAKIRAALERIGRPYAVVHGTGAARVASGLAALRRLLAPEDAASSAVDLASGAVDPTPPSDDAAGTTEDVRWRPVSWCDRCGVPGCERHQPGLARVHRDRDPGSDDVGPGKA